MKRHSLGGAAAAAIIAAGFGWQAYAQTGEQGRGGGSMEDMQMMGDMQGMEGMSKEMEGRMRMNMQTQVSPSDPAAMLAMQEELELTDQQVQELQSLVERTRQSAADVLTDEQRQQVEAMPQGPQTMMQMHRQMMERMGEHGMMGGRGGMMMGQQEKAAMGCPMMRMMNMMGGDHSKMMGGMHEMGGMMGGDGQPGAVEESEE